MNQPHLPLSQRLPMSSTRTFQKIIHYVFLNLLILNLSASLFAQEEKSSDSEGNKQPSVAEVVSQLDQEIEKAEENEKSVLNDALEIRKKLTDVDREWKNLAGQLEKIKKEQEQLTKKFDEQLEAAKKAFKKYEESQKSAETTQKAAEEAAKKAEEQKKRAKAAFEESEKLAAVPIETKQMLAKIEEKLPSVEKTINEKKDERDGLLAKITSLEAKSMQFNESRNRTAAKIESVLKEAGKWVSFSEEIAPIFHQRCIACHDSQSPQGQYDMSTYRDVMAGGESGSAIEPGDSENSLLCFLIEDGSMPKDADSLSPQQVNTIQKWINLGARLGHNTDPDESLIRIMPRQKQPAAPHEYRVPLPVTALAIHPENQSIASSGYHEVLLWSLDGKLIKRIGHLAERIYGLSFHPDGSLLAVASGTPGRLGEVKIFNVLSGELVQDLYIAEDAMFCVKWSTEGKQLAACGANGSIIIFNHDEEQNRLVQKRTISDHADWVNDLAWSKDDQKIVSASRDKTAKVFNAKDGELLLTFSKHSHKVFDVDWILDSSDIVSSGADNTLRIWDSKNGKEIRTIKLTEVQNCLSVLQNQLCISGGVDSKMLYHNLADGKQVRDQSFTGQWISSLRVSRDQQYVVTGDQSGTITLQKISTDAQSESSQLRQWLAVPQRSDD